MKKTLKQRFYARCLENKPFIHPFLYCNLQILLLILILKSWNETYDNVLGTAQRGFQKLLN